MSKLFFARPRSLATAVAIFLCVAVMAPAHSASQFETLSSAAGVPATDVLPAVSNPRPYRQTVVVNCDGSRFGSVTACLMIFSRVPAGRLLEIKTITCLVPLTTTDVLLFKSQFKLDNDHVIAILPTVGAASTQLNGPIYVNARETPMAYVAGGSSTDRAFCAIHGTLWRAN